jgi:hypothetical protein
MNQLELQPPRTRAVSGKLIILSILALALLAAGTSWVFRYNATHQAAEFWGPNAARLIRDGPKVEFVERSDGVNPDYLFDVPVVRRDISSARGLTHLRNALLEDRSFDWSPRERVLPYDWRHWGLRFRDSELTGSLVIWFSEDFCQAMRVTRVDPGRPIKVISCEPIANGLAEMFSEFGAALSKR